MLRVDALTARMTATSSVKVSPSTLMASSKAINSSDRIGSRVPSRLSAHARAMVAALSRVSMTQDSKITKSASNRHHGCGMHDKAVAMAVFIAAAIIFLSACQRKPVMTRAHFIHLPNSGWTSATPLTFRPVYDDSTLTYSLTLAVRHENRYRYSNLSLVVDLIAIDSTVNRQTINMSLADEYGNWKGGGFGSLYQDTASIARVVAPEDAKRIVVWQAMEGCDTLGGLTDVGVFVHPL